MLYQLPSGRTIELSIEQYLDMTDEELTELDCLGSSYTMEINNPFYGSYTGKRNEVPQKIHDEHNLIDMPEAIKRDDKYFHNNDEKE
tara:strand:+ start:2562 stop:2822 length:261 start_codon:yes stop_codon:yes gene_type:complete